MHGNVAPREKSLGTPDLKVVFNFAAFDSDINCCVVKLSWMSKLLHGSVSCGFSPITAELGTQAPILARRYKGFSFTVDSLF